MVLNRVLSQWFGNGCAFRYSVRKGMTVVAPGPMVMGIILFMGAVSGVHLNPGVSLAFALRGDFPWKRVSGYIVTQLIGATLACLFLSLVFGNVEHLGATLSRTNSRVCRTFDGPRAPRGYGTRR